MSIYLALYPGVYREWLIVFVPPVYRDLVRDVLDGLGDTLRAYIVGQLSTMFILGGLTAIGLAAVGVPYWLTFGVFSGVAALVPVFGVLLATCCQRCSCWGAAAGLSKALLVIGVGVVVHVIDGNVVSPLVMSKRVDLPPVLTMLAVLIAGALLGPLGLVVAVPLLAAIMVVVRRILIERIYAGRGFRRARATGRWCFGCRCRTARCGCRTRARRGHGRIGGAGTAMVVVEVPRRATHASPLPRTPAGGDRPVRMRIAGIFVATADGGRRMRRPYPPVLRSTCGQCSCPVAFSESGTT